MVPSHITILHVEQEVVGDDTQALDSVLECDTARNALLKEEAELSAKIQSTRCVESVGLIDPILMAS